MGFAIIMGVLAGVAATIAILIVREELAFRRKKRDGGVETDKFHG